MGDRGGEYDNEDEAVADAISRWSTTAMATIVGVRDRRHNARSQVEDAILTLHTLSACINGEEQCSEADDVEFEEGQKETKTSHFQG